MAILIMDRPLYTAWVIFVLTATIWFAVKMASHRRYFRKLRRQGLPMPPHNLFFGHLPALVRVVLSMPSDAHPLYLSTRMRQMHPDLGPDFYLDVWPFAPAMLVVGSLDILRQIAFDHVLQKTDILRNFLRPLTDGYDIVSMEGATWKKWRAIFNPGFSPSHLLTLVPTIVQEVQIYCDILDEHASKHDVFQMKHLTDNLILDVIGQVTLGIHFNCQRVFNPIIYSLRTQVEWLTTGVENNPINRYHPFRPFVHWYHGRILTKYIQEELDKRSEMWMGKRESPLDQAVASKKARTVIDLTLKAYTESQDQGNGQSNSVMDPHFRKMCVSQLKVFLLSGHDTTSSALCFHLWLLSQHPKALARLREEHSLIFGSPQDSASMIKASPHLLNQIPFTTAVIKESLRLFPTVTVSRQGEADFNIVNAQGQILPTKDMVVWPNQHGSHYDPAYWPKPESFLPERWLVDSDDPLYPPKGAWRAFEQGPRNCIAQDLAMIEMKIALVLVSRSYIVEPVYEELDAKAGIKHSPEIMGQKAYQIDRMGPRGDLPVRVTKLAPSKI